jgi:2',3'-cyclic-nucleotide 2'-phosphodiesterase (5'-nucleotidase family)
MGEAMKAKTILSMAVSFTLGSVSGCGGNGTTTSAGTVIGSTSVQLDTRREVVRTNESPVANFMMDTLLADMRAAGHQVDIAFTNAGGIRGGTVDANGVPTTPEAQIGKIYPVGPLTDLDVAGWYPLNKDSALMPLTGTQLRSVLERGVSLLPPDIRNDLGGPFLQVAGVKFTVDCAGTPQKLSAPTDPTQTQIVSEGTRIVKIELEGPAGVIYDVANGIDKLASTTVNIATNLYITQAGHSGQVTLWNAQNKVTVLSSDFDFVAHLQAAVKKQSPIAPKNEGRITIMGTCGMPLN